MIYSPYWSGWYSVYIGVIPAIKDFRRYHINSQTQAIDDMGIIEGVPNASVLSSLSWSIIIWIATPTVTFTMIMLAVKTSDHTPSFSWKILFTHELSHV